MSDTEAGASPAVVDSRIAHDGWVTVRIDRLRYPSGNESTVEIVDHPGAVTLLAVDDQESLLLVRQYRHPAGRVLLELPAGTLEDGEDPEVCALRELQEETGYTAAQLERLGGFYSAPGFCSEYLHVYLATGLSESSLEGDEEDIHLVRMPLDDALARIASGEIEDAKTVAALLMYLRRVGRA